MDRQIELLGTLDTASCPSLPRFIERMRAFAALPSDELPEWADPIELQGVRIGISDIDYVCMSFLKEILLIDGLIAPRMPSPFHDQGEPDVRKSFLYEELILFRPNDVLRHVIDRPPGPIRNYFVQTVLFQPHLLAFHLQQSRTVAPYRTLVGREWSAAMPVRDEAWENMMRTPSLYKAYTKERRSWKAIAKRLHRAFPGLARPCVYLPLATPDLG